MPVDTAVEVPETPEVPAEKTVPESRLKGIIKEKAALEQQLKQLQAKLDAKATEGLTEIERMKVEKEALTAQLTEAAKRGEERDARLKQIALRAHLTDAATPAVARLVPADIVEVDDDGELTSASKKAIGEWKKRADVAPLFTPARRPGNTPAPTDTDSGMGKAQYYTILADPKATPEQKQKAHEAFVRSLAK